MSWPGRGVHLPVEAAALEASPATQRVVEVERVGPLVESRIHTLCGVHGNTCFTSPAGMVTRQP
jgi:hypothetical protein